MGLKKANTGVIDDWDDVLDLGFTHVNQLMDIELTQALGDSDSVDRCCSWLVGHQSQLSKVLSPVAASDLHLRVVLLACLRLQTFTFSHLSDALIQSDLQ